MVHNYTVVRTIEKVTSNVLQRRKNHVHTGLYGDRSVANVSKIKDTEDKNKTYGQNQIFLYEFKRYKRSQYDQNVRINNTISTSINAFHNLYFTYPRTLYINKTMTYTFWQSLCYFLQLSTVIGSNFSRASLVSPSRKT